MAGVWTDGVERVDLFSGISGLVVDPNRHMRRLVRGLLQAFRFREVREADDGAEAFKEWRTFPADVVVTELQMAPVDGLDFVRLVRTAPDSPNPRAPVLMLTAYTERHHVVAARDVGVSEFMAKPVSAEALYARLYAAVFRPRPFIVSKHYCGPDRRRRQVRYAGPERRRDADGQDLF